MQKPLRIALISPAPAGSTLGNQITAIRWRKIFSQLGHRARILATQAELDQTWDLVIALHATKSASWVRHSKTRFPDRTLMVCLTGTDLHQDLAGPSSSRASRTAKRSIYAADRIILLEPQGVHELADAALLEEVQGKAVLIYQSAHPVKNPPPSLKTRFEVSLVAHLRDAKDPFRAAYAASLLPPDSRITVVHFGQALSDSIARKAREVELAHPRYRWLGARPHGETQRRLARSKLMVLTSKIEGAPGAVSEAIVNGVPVLASRIPATLGMLGKDYPGLFTVGATKELAMLMERAESDASFLNKVRQYVKKLRPQFLLRAEVNRWKQVLDSM